MKNKKVIGYKGFDKDLKCNNFQFKEGKQFIHNGEVKLCEKGFHFCEHPFDVFGYYGPANSRFALVEAENVSDEKSDDSKRVAEKITIKTELGLHAYIDMGIKFIFERVSFLKKDTNKRANKAVSNSGDYGAASNSGNYGAASNSGDSGAASNSGYSGAASNSGYSGAASNSGKEGIAMSVGIDSKAKGILGTWIVLSEWEYKDNEYHRIDVKTAKIDGKLIKADTFYQLKDGKFIIAE